MSENIINQRLDKLKNVIASIENLLEYYLFETNDKATKDSIMEEVDKILEENDYEGLSVEWISTDKMYMPSIVIKPEIEITFFVKSMAKRIYK